MLLRSGLILLITIINFSCSFSQNKPPKSEKKMFTMKFGAIRDIGIFTVKLDVDPVTKRVTAGTGLNF